MACRLVRRTDAWRDSMTEGDFVKVLRLAALPLPLVAHGFGADTALDPYVKKADAWYKYEVVSTTRGEGYTAYVIDLTSQAWRDMAERRQVSPQVHHRGARDSGHGAVPALPTQS